MGVALLLLRSNLRVGCTFFAWSDMLEPVTVVVLHRVGEGEDPTDPVDLKGQVLVTLKALEQQKYEGALDLLIIRHIHGDIGLHESAVFGVQKAETELVVLVNGDMELKIGPNTIAGMVSDFYVHMQQPNPNPVFVGYPGTSIFRRSEFLGIN